MDQKLKYAFAADAIYLAQVVHKKPHCKLFKEKQDQPSLTRIFAGASTQATCAVTHVASAQTSVLRHSGAVTHDSLPKSFLVDIWLYIYLV